MDIGTILDVALGVIFAIFVIAIVLNIFGDMIFEQLAELRDSWNRHLGKDRDRDADDKTGF